ncbi:MAG TPA: DUF805 domain-containing protein [Terriglobales bacterium]|nr:DUF805 domain-containing protein [Terriglobales bacterium]
MSWYLQALKKYAVFEGRATRQEYWMYVLFNSIAAIVFMIVDAVLGSSANGMPFGMLTAVYLVGTILPSLAVLVRRLHDTNRSGWWVLISLVPFGGLVLLVFAVQDSDAGVNQFGPNPKGVIAPIYPAQPYQAMAQAAGAPMGQPQPYYPQPAQSMPPPPPIPATAYQTPAAAPSIGFAPAPTPQYPAQPVASPAPSPYQPQPVMPPPVAAPQPAAPVATNSPHKFCGNCGAPLAAGAHFCANCGGLA